MPEHSRELTGRLAACLVRYRNWLLAACLLTGLVAIGPAGRLRFDRRISSMFPAGDPRLASYLEEKGLFGELDACAVLYTDPQLVTADGLARLGRFADKLRRQPGVSSVFSLADARRPAAPLDPRPLAEQLGRGDVTPEQLRRELLANKTYKGTLIGPDGQTAAIVVRLQWQQGTDESRERTIAALRRLADAHNPPAVVAGEPVLVNDVFAALAQDGRLLGFSSTVLLSLVIGLLFRNLRWLVLPLAVVQLSVVWTKAILVLSGMRLSMVSSPLVALITVIGVATVVHVTMCFREQRERAEPAEALRRTVQTIGPAVWWTCMTTAAGFASLLASRVVPVQSFAVMTALGSLLVFFAVVGAVPGGVLLGRYHTDPRRAPGEKALTAGLRAVVRGVERHPWPLAVGSTAALLLAALGLLRLQVAADFTENFRQSTPIVQSYNFLVRKMGTVASFDLLVDTPEQITARFLARVRAMQQELEKADGVRKTISLTDILELLHRPSGPSPGLLQGLGRAVVRLVPVPLQLQLMRQMAPGLVDGFWNRQGQVLRVLVQVEPRHGPQAKKALIAEVERIGQKHFPGRDGGRPARAAGGYLLLTFLVETLLADQWTTFALAVASIFVLLSLAFRSLRLGLVALIPNAAPILIVVGSMGWIGLPVNIATAMLASVSMGLSVDFSIHYLFRYQRERSAGQSFYAALRAAHQSVGLAMVLANIALVAGFCVLTVSSFIPTVHFGILVSVAMLGGLAGNLVVLPLLLRWTKNG